jgi:hypothetical protein
MFKLRRPSPAMGVAAFALFIALGGVSVAATNLVPANSVGTQQIQNNSVTRAKIAHQSITSVLIKPGSLMASDFAAGQIPAGPKGDTGAAGAKGAPGATGPAGVVGKMTVITKGVWLAQNTGGTVSVIGNQGQQAIAAGTSWDPSWILSDQAQLATVSVHPILGSSGQPIGYEARGFNGTGNGHWFVIHVSFG